MNWGQGYKSGFMAAVEWCNNDHAHTKDQQWIDDHILRDPQGGPSCFAVANSCCGGVDGHQFPCQKGVS